MSGTIVLKQYLEWVVSKFLPAVPRVIGTYSCASSTWSEWYLLTRTTLFTTASPAPPTPSLTSSRLSGTWQSRGEGADSLRRCCRCDSPRPGRLSTSPSCAPVRSLKPSSDPPGCDRSQCLASGRGGGSSFGRALWWPELGRRVSGLVLRGSEERLMRRVLRAVSGSELSRSSSAGSRGDSELLFGQNANRLQVEFVR